MSRGFINSMETAFDEFIGEYECIAGCIVSNGEVIYERYTGYANFEYKTSITRNTVFPISSVTKQFTGMLTAIMAEEGKISYKDRMVDYFPELAHFGEGITILHMLHQTTGLPDMYNFYEENSINSYNVNNSIIFEELKKQTGLTFPTGERFDYCNSNYMLLAMIAEKVYGKSYGEILKEKIFMPLGMNKSGVYDKRYMLSNRAYGYSRADGELLTMDCQWLSYGDGGIFSTLEDLILWDSALYGEMLVKRPTLDMIFNSGRTNAGDETGYGFGWVIRNINNIKILRHAGGDPGFGSMICRIPGKYITMILLSNLDNSWSKLTQLTNSFETNVLKD